MTIQTLYRFFSNRQQYLLSAGLALLTTLNVFLDFLFTRYHNSAFYLTESLLFSSWWILFLPFLSVLSVWIRKTPSLTVQLFLTLAAIAAHLLVYPIVIWVISALFFDHTFSCWQTFHFALSAYFIKSIIIYGGWFIAIKAFAKIKEQPAEQTRQSLFISSILVSDSQNRRKVLSVNEVLYFSAKPPYMEIGHISRKYLQTGTLKALQKQLDPAQFVRIHKSHIVNLSVVAVIQSRQNGDYDITLTDGTVLRVSRNYASDFKTKFSGQHQVNAK